MDDVRCCTQCNTVACRLPLQVHLKDTGSILSLSWTADSTQLAGSGGSGAVAFGQVVDQTLEDGKMQVRGCSGQQVQSSSSVTF